MLNDGDLLLRAILEEPHEDSHRLIYADWLEEHGHEERAEFIRIEIELATLRYGKLRDDARYKKLRQREHVLLTGNKPAEPMLPTACTMVCSLLVRDRGFFYRLHCTLADWLQHGTAIVLAQPVTEVWVTDRQSWSGRLHGDNPEPTLSGWWTASASWFLSRPGNDLLPDCLMEILAASLPQITPRSVRYQAGHGCVMFPSPEAAHAALSRAAVTWARRQAGLPDLPEGK